MKGFTTIKKFGVISVSGGTCSLNCFYCTTKYIQSMEPANEGGGDYLYKIIKEKYEKGVRGFLISGGFDENGELINIRETLKILKKIKKEYGDNIVFNIHPGLVERDVIEEMSDVIDMVDFEFAYSEKAFKSKGLRNRKREDYVKVLQDFIDVGPKYIVPHIMLGLPNDDVEEAIRVASSMKPYLINFLVMIPTPGTPSSKISLPSLDEIVSKIKLGSSLMNKKISLGCMRPYKIKEDLDRIFIKEELGERISNPSHKVLKDFNLEMYDACCSLPEKYFPIFKVISNR
ncbi:radical SAM protein [Acidianus sulfidivorans JP7]|uniref:Radical SAM protein n=1 Tax=Acidianus sulfidivorans JP7 TaxID=619593 RepID=A0A2U9IPV2_9CREN|nr:radical SAM protein [Acidianus sulfidivorans]AWR98006.1 radical SAM protein [Acidianus sulfidivorans JP7]